MESWSHSRSHSQSHSHGVTESAVNGVNGVKDSIGNQQVYGVASWNRSRGVNGVNGVKDSRNQRFYEAASWNWSRGVNGVNDVKDSIGTINLRHGSWSFCMPYGPLAWPVCLLRDVHAQFITHVFTS
jgi:hypothetical protein